MAFAGSLKIGAVAALRAVASTLASTAFRHRLLVLAVPIAVELVTQAQAAFTGATPDATVRVAVDTAALFLANYLRGLIAPA
jgi:hypothetical protein